MDDGHHDDAAGMRAARLRRLRWGTFIAGLVVAALSAWLVLLAQHAPHPAPLAIPYAGQEPVPAPPLRLVEISGAVEVERIGVVAGSSANLAPGDRIAIGAGGTATLVADHDATRLTLAAGTTLRLLWSTGNIRLALDAGSLAAVVAAQPPNRPMRISTPHAELRVVGTRFSLAVSTSTTMSVTEGTVAVRRRGEPTEVMIKGGTTYDSAGVGTTSGPAVVWVRNALWERIISAGMAMPGNRVVSQAMALGGDPLLHGDQLIRLQSGIPGRGDGIDRLFLIPDGMTIELHCRAERQGTVMVALATAVALPGDANTVRSRAVPVGPAWTTIAIAGDTLASRSFPHGLPVATKVTALIIAGSAAGPLELDRILVRGGPPGAH